MHEQPLVAAAAALVAGVAVGLLIPSTRKEDELMGETRDQLIESAREVRREAMETARDVTRTAADAVRSELESEGSPGLGHAGTPVNPSL
jgi:hypothetical protein